MTGTLTDPVNAFLIPFLVLSHSDAVYDFTLKTYMFTLKWKDKVVGLTARGLETMR